MGRADDRRLPWVNRALLTALNIDPGMLEDEVEWVAGGWPDRDVCRDGWPDRGLAGVADPIKPTSRPVPLEALHAEGLNIIMLDW